MPLCKLHVLSASCSYRLVPKMALTLCNLRWWCFSFHINLRKYSTCTHGGHRPLQLALVVFFLGTLAHLVMCRYCNLQFVVVVVLVVVFLCCGGNCIYVVVVAVHGGFAAVAQLTEDRFWRTFPAIVYLVAHWFALPYVLVRGYNFCPLRNLESQKMSLTIL